MDRSIKHTPRRDITQRLDYHLEQRQIALDLVAGRTPNTQLQQETAHAAALRENIERQEQELQRLQSFYEERLKAISTIYNDLVQSVLSETYSGALSMIKGELQFPIREAAGLMGEAVETLALVLADVAAMVCSCQGIGHHPRFLVHDSPREADLDRHIYDRYLRAMWALTKESGGIEDAPFQYIVTTTSRPPEAVKEAICLRLEAHPPSHMLLRCVLRNPEMPHTPGLFDSQEAATEHYQGMERGGSGPGMGALT